jgi:hypothetical protein
LIAVTMPAAPSPASAAPTSTAAAFALGAVVAVAGTAVVWFAGLLAPELRGYLLGGTAAALGAGGIAVALHGRFLAATGLDGALLAGRLQALLAAAFGAKLVVLLGAIVAQQSCGAQFEATVVFCVTFASAALVSQLATAIALARALARRSPAPPAVRAATASRPKNPT